LAPTFDQADWTKIVHLHDLLTQVASTPTVALARAAAISMASGPEAVLVEIEALERDGYLALHHRLYASRADLLRRRGRNKEAARACRAAIDLARNVIERELGIVG
jgi:RNA polymerase sigma-70 factor (ECF subfamily)